MTKLNALDPTPALSEAVEAAVGRAEAQAHVEIVVVWSERSGRYRDRALLAAAAASLALLMFVLFSPFHFDEWWIPAELMLAFGALSWLVDRSPPLLRLFTSEARRAAQVDQAAAAAFHQERVHATRERCGVLLYYSRLEGELRLLPDVGVEAKVPLGELNAVPLDASSVDALAGTIDALGLVLARHMPGQPDRPSQLPNHPRIRT